MMHSEFKGCVGVLLKEEVTSGGVASSMISDDVFAVVKAAVDK